jgi:hypothetical protein
MWFVDDLAFAFGPTLIRGAEKLNDVTRELNRKTAGLVVYLHRWQHTLYAESWPS